MKPKARVETDRPLSPYTLIICFKIPQGGLSHYSQLQNFQTKTHASSLVLTGPFELDEYRLPTDSSYRQLWNISSR